MIKDLYERHKHVIIFSSILTLIFLIIFFSYAKNPLKLKIKNLYYYSLNPIQRSFFNISQNLSIMRHNFKKIDELSSEISILKDEINKYENQYNEFQLLKQENENLKQQLEFKKSIDNKSVFAMVIGVDPANYYKTIIVNKGAEDGVMINMPVISYFHGEKVLVGKIFDVGPRASRVITILDARCYVGISIQLTEQRENGIMSGAVNDFFYCKIDYVSRTATLQKGDRVMTSGLGGLYPENINIGNIVQIEKKNYGPFQQAFLKPFVNFSSIEEVYIILKEKNDKLEQWLKS